MDQIGAKLQTFNVRDLTNAIWSCLQVSRMWCQLGNDLLTPGDLCRFELYIFIDYTRLINKIALRFLRFKKNDLYGKSLRLLPS